MSNFCKMQATGSQTLMPWETISRVVGRNLTPRQWWANVLSQVPELGTAVQTTSAEHGTRWTLNSTPTGLPRYRRVRSISISMRLSTRLAHSSEKPAKRVPSWRLFRRPSYRATPCGCGSFLPDTRLRFESCTRCWLRILSRCRVMRQIVFARPRKRPELQ